MEIIDKKGSLIISLYFELIWRVFDKVNLKAKEKYFHNTREATPKLLELFQKYQISCTWATVGVLFNRDWVEWDQNIPFDTPNYTNKKLSAYKYAQKTKNIGLDEFFFAPDLIKAIQKTKNQEIGMHTHSHYNCLEPEQDAKAFEVDLGTSIRLSKQFDIKLESLVFPRNQFNDDYMKICEKNGIKQVGSNPTNWYRQNTQKDSLFQKIFRTGDTYFGNMDKSYPPSFTGSKLGTVVSQPASRLLRLYSENKILNNLKIQKIKNEMKSASIKGEVYHLCWRPHNFGNNPEENLDDLEHLLNFYQKCKIKYGFKSLNMKTLFNN